MCIEIQQDSEGEICRIEYSPERSLLLIHIFACALLLVMFWGGFFFFRSPVEKKTEMLIFVPVLLFVTLISILYLTKQMKWFKDKPCFVFEREVFKYVIPRDKEIVYQWEHLDRVSPWGVLTFRGGERILLPQEFWQKNE